MPRIVGMVGGIYSSGKQLQNRSKQRCRFFTVSTVDQSFRFWPWQTAGVSWAFGFNFIQFNWLSRKSVLARFEKSISFNWFAVTMLLPQKVQKLDLWPRKKVRWAASPQSNANFPHLWQLVLPWILLFWRLDNCYSNKKTLFTEFKFRYHNNALNTCSFGNILGVFWTFLCFFGSISFPNFFAPDPAKKNVNCLTKLDYVNRPTRTIRLFILEEDFAAFLLD